MRGGIRTPETVDITRAFVGRIASLVEAQVPGLKGKWGTPPGLSGAGAVQYIDQARFQLGVSLPAGDGGNACDMVLIARVCTDGHLWWGLTQWQGSARLAHALAGVFEGLPLPVPEVVAAVGKGVLGSEAMALGGKHFAAGRSMVADELCMQPGLEAVAERIAGDLVTWHGWLTERLPAIGEQLAELLPNRPARRYWKVSVGAESALWNEFRQKGLISVSGWGIDADVSRDGPSNAKEFREKLKAAGQLPSELEIGDGLTQLWAFYRGIQPGDMVCACGGKQILGCGSVTGSYVYHGTEFFASRKGWPAHCREVAWRTAVPATPKRLSASLARKLQQNTPILELTADEWEELDAMEPARRYWKISVGEGGKDWPEFRRRSCIGLRGRGFDLSTIGVTGRDELSSHYKEHGDTLAGYSASQDWRLYQEMAVGDGVCAYGRQHILGWGEVTGEYEFAQDDFPYALRRQVRWDNTAALPTSQLSEAWRGKLRQRITLFELAEAEWDEITGTSPPPPPPDALALVSGYLSSRGLHFTPWQIATFYTALQTKGFVILSGISGTGKTKLAQHFAAMLPQPLRAAKTADDAIPTTVRPYMLRHGRINVPLSAADLVELPELGKPVEMEVQIGEYAGPGLFAHYRENGYDKAQLNLRTEGKAPFRAVFKEGDRLLITPRFSEVGTLSGFALLTGEEHISLSSATEPGQNWLFIPVRPDWRDGKGLLGYYNPLTGTYEWTPFLRFLVQARDSYRRRDRLAWFVLLDEMNLAHVEHYFADLLSVLESGRVDTGDEAGCTREPIRIGYPDDAEGDLPPSELRLPPNLHIVGTVNVDETTYAFSPKVLDRAFTLELTEADFSDYPPQSQLDGDGLDDGERQALLQGFTSNGAFRRVDKSVIADFVDANPDVRDRLQRLNALLQPHSLHFGYRVFDEIVAFLAAAEESSVFAGIGGDDPAFDAAALMKILPKFHGSRGKLEEPLRRVLAWCTNPDSPDCAALPEGEAALESLTTCRLPRTAERVRRLLRELYVDGFAAFG